MTGPSESAQGDEVLLRVTVHREADVFPLRQHGRDAAAALGLDGQNQIRVATSLSDVGRELVRLTTPTTLVFLLRRPPSPALLIRVETVDTDGPGWDTARRLMDEVLADPAATTLVKALPASPPAPDEVERLRRRLTAWDAPDSLDELRAQNQDLVQTLEDLEAKQRELVRLNEELEDTNRGIIALHKELSDELEQTNQGVVALYAELEEKTTQLREAAEARTRFWSNISHELRSPVNSVLGLARLLADPHGDPLTEEQRRQVSLIEEAGSTLLALINELLDTAKAESGSLRPRFAPVDLPLLLAGLHGSVQPLVRSAEVELVVDHPAPMPELITDEVMLQRVLRNLLSNALKFTERGVVRLAVDLDADSAVFVVSDTGIGIPEPEQNRIFEDFYQVPGRLQVGAGGTGLGLPYARRLARILGGDLVLRSAPGEGTEVTVRLPLRQADDSTAALALVVVPDDGVRSRLVAALDGLAERVLEVGDGRAALAAARRERPDLVLLAADVPLVSGTEILSVLRGDERSRSVPVVLVGPDGDSGLERTAAAHAATVLAAGGVAPDAVRDAVRAARTLARAEGDRPGDDR
ncbi:ATP-binding response regulator [Saccharothrix syringae]|uniref:histidine kinase n=1 Tax=Saccharothrix syringae TaxID=103733 RepID=A0A5Q0GXL9_SACSY|nr:ATP-binding protein [Saccharothrix syringae]QFZ18264.1 response regulator [Saccharothrix syringae]